MRSSATWLVPGVNGGRIPVDVEADPVDRVDGGDRQGPGVGAAPGQVRRPLRAGARMPSSVPSGS